MKQLTKESYSKAEVEALQMEAYAAGAGDAKVGFEDLVFHLRAIHDALHEQLQKGA